ncbi:MAG: T9SS type A sorting domain-containing protein [Bacteroidota bacterium]
MKKLFTLTLTMALLVFSIASLDAQTPRKALAELVTQASCPPCASNNPITVATINANPDDAILLAYQVWWPGFDPMYLDNPEEVRDRVEYYGVTGAPTVTVQGTTDAGGNLSQVDVNNATSTMSEFAMDLEASILNGVINVTGTISTSMAASGDFRLRVALAEDLITIQDAPGGTNGETEYHHVFKRFFGGSEGVDLQDDWADGDTYTVDLSLPITTTNVYNVDQLEIVAWIQNDANRYIHQATKITDLESTFTIANNVAAVETTVSSTEICSGTNTIEPTFKLGNLGSEMLTSADIVYSVNGGAEQTFNWTGSVMPLNTETVTLDAITFDHTDVSTLSVSAINPNGAEDENADDNASSVEMGSAPLFMHTIELTINTDLYADEIYWQVTDDAGMIVAAGGNPNVGLNNINTGLFPAPPHPDMYPVNVAATYNETIVLPADDCYQFTITDYYGDGLINGGYELADDAGIVHIVNADYGSAREDHLGEGAMLVNAQDVEFTAKFAVSPNPVLDVAQLAFTLDAANVTTIAVANSLGQVVRTENLGKLPTGTHNMNLDMTGLAAGVYLINITSGDISGTQKVVVASH